MAFQYLLLHVKLFFGYLLLLKLMCLHSVLKLCPPDLQRRSLELEERKYLVGRGVVTETQSNMGRRIHIHPLLGLRV